MPIARRDFLACVSVAPILASCASDFARYRGASPADLAASLGIGSACFATLRAGKIRTLAALPGAAGSNATAPDAVFQAASLTKPVVAYLALQWALAGQLDLSAPVSHYLPQGYTHFHSVLARGPGDRSDHVPARWLSAIPLSTLLNHTAGLPNWSARPMALSFAPGTRWQYSGEGYLLLQSVMEAVAGTDFASLMDAQVFKPLGMRQSSLVWTPALAARAPTGQSAWLSPGPLRFNSPLAAASLYTSAEDYARFLVAFLADGRLAALTASKAVTVDLALGIDWGYGWGIEPAARGKNLWQWGNNPGFRSFAMVAPDSGDGFVVFTNSDAGMPLAAAIAYEVLPTAPMTHKAFEFSMVG